MHVLLVEDNDLDAGDITRLLDSVLGESSDVHRVRLLAEARRALQGQRYDVVLVDLSLPDADGADAVKALVAEDDSRPLIVLSGADSLELAVDLVRLGAQDHLVKGHIDADGVLRSVRYAVERKRIERRLQYLAAYDQLTGLANRQHLRPLTEKAMAHADRSGSKVGLLVIDLDRFKTVNDRHGHAVGDELLAAAAQRLARVVRRGDTVARLGGDEFAVVLESVETPFVAETVAEKILHALSLPFEVDGVTCSVGSSIGITLYPDDGRDMTTLLKNADIAMYKAKATGNAYQFYTSAMNEQVLHRHALREQIRSALALEQFTVRYLPVADLRSGSLAAFESQVIWRRPGDAPLSLDELLPLVEEAELGRELGSWILETVCRQVIAWDRAGLGAIPVIVRVVPAALVANALAPLLRQVLAGAGVPPSLVRLELPEALLTLDTQAGAARLRELQAMGVSLAIDGFGIGHASINRLKELPISVLKLGRDFVGGIDTSPEGAAIVDSVVRLVQNLGKEVLASGVATLAQLRCLRQSGCHYAQGSLFGPDMSATEAGLALALTEGAFRHLLRQADVVDAPAGEPLRRGLRRGLREPRPASGPSMGVGQEATH